MHSILTKQTNQSPSLHGKLALFQSLKSLPLTRFNSALKHAKSWPIKLQKFVIKSPKCTS